MRAIQRLQEHWKPLLGAGAAGLLPLLVLFWPALGLDRLYFGHDIGLQQLALAQQARESLAAGELPFWNHRMFAGTPLLAPANGGVLSPAWILTAWLPLGPSFTFHAVLSLWLAYAGAAWCAWRRTHEVGAAILAGYVFMLGAPVFLRVFAGHTTILGCLWALPWMFSAGEALLERPRGSQLLLLAAMTAVLLVGNPHLALLAIVAFGGSMTVRAAAGWWGDRDTKRWGAVIGWMAVAGVLGVLLAAPQLFPGMEFAEHSSRGGGLTLETAKSSAAGLNHLPYYFFPSFYGDPAYGDANVMSPPPADGAGAPTVWEVCGYLGLIPLVLAALAWSVKRGRAYGLLALCAAGLALAHHTPLYTIAFYVIPKMDLFRTPGRWLIVATFALAICAAEGYALLRAGDETGATARRRFCWAVGAIAVLALVTALAATGVPYGFEAAGPAPNVGVPGPAYALLIVPLLAAGALAVAHLRVPLLARGVTPLLIVVALVELYAFGAPFIRKELLSESRWPKVIEETARRRGAGWRFDVMPIGAVDWVRGNHPQIHGLDSAGGYDPAVLRRYMQLYNVVHGYAVDRPTWNARVEPPKPGAGWSPLLPMLHMRYLVTKVTQLPRPMQLVTQDAGIHLYEYPHAMPRAYVVHLSTVVDDATRETELAALDALRAPDFAVREEAVVSAGGPKLDAVPPEAPEPVTVTESSAHRVVLEADVKARGLLVLLDTYYPGWSCTVNGVDTPIHRTNHAFRGVEVAPGKHTVVFTYRCAPFRNGVLTALLALAALGGAAWWLRRREDEPALPDEPAGEEQPADAR